MLYVVVGPRPHVRGPLPIGLRSLDEADHTGKERLTLVRSISTSSSSDLAHVTEDVGRTVIQGSDHAAVAAGSPRRLGIPPTDSFAFSDLRHLGCRHQRSDRGNC